MPDIRIGEFALDPSLHTVSGPEGTVRLEPKVMLVLLCLAEHPNQVITKERLMRAAWADTFVTDDVLTRAISELRRAFGDSVREPRFIQTIPKGGYRLIAPVFHPGPDNTGGVPLAEAGRETLPSRHADAETTRALIRPRSRLLGVVSVVGVVLLAPLVGQRMTTTPSVSVVRSIQLTFGGQVAGPPLLGDSEFFPALAVDGGRIYFTQAIGNQFTLAQASVRGGEAKIIPTPFSHALLLHMSPDGSRLLVREFDHARLEGPLWVIPVVGGAPLRLGDIVAHDGSWSPDGTRLVFARGEELYVAGSDGRDPRRLATAPGRPCWLRWSPDGTRLRFTLAGARGGAQSLWELSVDGRDLRPLSMERGDDDQDCCGEWSPDGRHFFFRRFREGRADIWVIAERKPLFGLGKPEPLRLTTGPLQFPAVVPSRDPGRLLVVGVQLRGENLRFDPRTREFATYHAGEWAGWFAFSRDREWVTYVENRGIEQALWRSRANGTESLQLTQPPLRLLLPRWSPDGTRIAFMGRMPGQPWKIYVVAAQGGEPQAIVDGDRAAGDPDWAPDGASLMFGRPPEHVAEPSAPRAIHVIDLETKKLSTLPGSDGLFAPRWSPSGRYVAALSMDQATLFLFDVNTRTWTELGRFKTVHNAVWSRDERFLYFQVVDEESIYRLRMADRAVEKVVALEGARNPAYWFCVFEGLDPDDSPLVSCHRYDPDIYALDWKTQ